MSHLPRFVFPLALTAALTAALTTALLASISARAANPDPQPPTPASALSNPFEQSLRQLSSENFTQRENAIATLQTALADQLRLLVAGPNPAPKDQQKAILEFQLGLSRWMLDTLKLPTTLQRQAEIDFATRLDILPDLVRLYGPAADQRLAALQNLDKSDDPQVASILARFIDAPDRALAHAAMQALAHRKPTEALVAPLWDRAVGARFPSNLPGMDLDNPTPVLHLRRTTPLDAQDADLACDLLISLKTHQVAPRLKDALRALDAAYGTEYAIFALTDTRGPLKSIRRLTVAYQPPEVLPPLYRLATGPLRQVYLQNLQAYATNRTLFIGLLLETTGQNADDYKLTRMKNFGDTWAFSSEADEKDAITKLQQWWEKNAPPGSAPATTLRPLPGNP